MEVLVSPNDGPQISIEDFDDTPDESPFTDEISHEFDSISMCDQSSAAYNHPRLFSDSLPDNQSSVDKLIDRRFACYGVSPRLTRKISNDSCVFAPVSKVGRPRTLDFKVKPLTEDSYMGETHQNQSSPRTKHSISN